MLRAQKESKLKQISEAFGGINNYAIVVDFTGLKIKDIDYLKSSIRQIGANCIVVKNKLAKVALKDQGFVGFVDHLTGPSMVIYGVDDISASAKLLKKFQKKMRNKFGDVKSIVYDKQHYKATEFNRFLNLPSKDELRSKLLGTLMAPANKLVQLLNAVPTQVALVLKAKVDKE